MPDHSNNKSELVTQMHNSAQDCEKKFPSNGKENKKTDECTTASFTELAYKDNYLAVAELANDACEQGKTEDAKKWLNTIVNSKSALKDDKDKAQDVIIGLDKK